MIWASLRKISRTRFDSILDLGCGDGSILRSLALQAHTKRAVGIDLTISDSNSGPVSLYRGNILEYKPPELFDLVVSNQVFEHIYEPWLPRYFQTLKQSCAPGGVIMISTPNRWRPKNLMRRLMLRPLDMMDPNPGVPPEQHLGHHRECSYRELRAILDQFFPEPEWNFEIVRLVPRFTESHARWITNLVIYFSAWLVWRPLLTSASQDHYALVQRNRL